jgi:hypothetical protein
VSAVADYYSLIARAVAKLPHNTEGARRAIYERARDALQRHLKTTTPETSPTSIAGEQSALEEAIRKVEAEQTPSKVAEQNLTARKQPSAPLGEKPTVPAQDAAVNIEPVRQHGIDERLSRDEQSAENRGSPSQSTVRADDPAPPATTIRITLKSIDGEPTGFSGSEKQVTAQIRDAVLAHAISGDETATVQKKAPDGKWAISETPVRKLPQLRSLYRPLRFNFWRAVGIGAGAGLAGETFYQSWLIYQHFNNMGPVILFWLPVAFVAGIIFDDVTGGSLGRFIFPGIIGAIFMGHGGAMLRSFDNIAEALSPTFGALVVSAAVGSTLGMTGIGGLAGCWVILNRRKLPATPDADQESPSTYLTMSIVLFVAFVGLFSSYIVWARHWPVNVMVSVQQDLKDHPTSKKR